MLQKLIDWLLGAYGTVYQKDGLVGVVVVTALVLVVLFVVVWLGLDWTGIV